MLLDAEHLLADQIDLTADFDREHGPRDYVQRQFSHFACNVKGTLAAFPALQHRFGT